MQERSFTNSTQVHFNNISLNTTTPHGNTPATSDVNGSLGYGMGRVLRAAFDYTYGAWQKWWHPAPSAATVAQQRHGAIYRSGLDVAVKQLDLALDNLRKNPSAASSLEQFKRVVHEHQKYLQPAPTENLRTYQTRLFHQLRNKVEQLKLARLRETVLAHFPLLQTKVNNFLSVDSAVPPETSNTQKKRSVAQQPPSTSVPAPQPAPAKPVLYQNPFNLTMLNGTNGFAVPGLNANDQLGGSVSTAGDINGDGLADLVLGAYHASPRGRTEAGTVYVLLGQASGWPAQFNLTMLNGTNGFAIPGLNPGDLLGNSVSMAGDINGDEIADLVLGAPLATPPGHGRSDAGIVYVILGQASGWPAQFNLTKLNGTNGFAIPGLKTYDELGRSVSTAGDINGDKIADLVLGADNAAVGGRNASGTVYVLFGQASGWPAQFNLTTLNGTNGFTIPGLNANGLLGCSVSTAGDMNGDKLSDLLLGANGVNSGVGTVYVLLGQASGWPAQFNLTMLNGTNGFAIPGLNAGDISGVNAVGRLGDSVSTAGDINGDGLSDLLLGALSASPGGTTYVLLGQASGWPAQFNLNTLNGTNGFAIRGLNANDNLGCYVSTAGDINGDGLSDLLLAAEGASPGGRNKAGTVYVLLGQASGWPAQFNLTTLDGANGFAIPGLNAGDNLAHSVSSVGDFNGDGRSDLLLGAYLASPGNRTSAGTAYVILGLNTMTSIPAFSPMPMPSPTPMMVPQLAPSNPTISPEPTPSPNPSANLIPQNLTACPLNQSLQWLHHDIIIASAQVLRLSPQDISVACGNSSQPYLAAYFSVTNLQSATLQYRNASGGWNVGELSFFGQDLATGQVALVQNGSAIVPELTVTATDGVTTLLNQAIQVQFTLIDSSPVLISFQLAVPVDSRVTVTSKNIVLSSSTGKVADLVVTVTNVTQNGYFAQNDTPNVPITSFTGYQVQTGQIQVVHTGGNEPIHFNIKVSDGLMSSVVQPETVVLYGMPNNPVTKIGTIVGCAVAGGIVLAGGLAAYYRRHLLKKEMKEIRNTVAKRMNEKKQVS